MRKRCVVIGLDGVPWTLLQKYLKQGLLPNLQAILGDGNRLLQMDASLPDISSVSWASFLTGVNPGEHGIFGFMDLKPHSYDLCFPDSGSIKAPVIWDILGKTLNGRQSSLSRKFSGKFKRAYRSIILNIPQTNPASPMNGVLVAGFVALDLKKAVYPDSAYRVLDSMGYVIDVDATLARDRKDLFLKSLFESLEKRKRAFNHFFAEEDWDLCIAAFTETDRLHHFFFDAAYDENHPFYPVFVDFYQRLDQYLGELYSRFGAREKGGRFIILSDHGFAEIKREVYVNAFLRREGFLKLKKEGDFFDGIEAPTRAFALDPCRVYLNTRERFPRGGVRESEREGLIGEITASLRQLKDESGAPVMQAVYRAEAIYTGDETKRGPDLVCMPHPGFDLKGLLKEERVFGKRHFTGMHTRRDAHCVVPDTIPFKGRPHIEDMAGIILNFFAGD